MENFYYYTGLIVTICVTIFLASFIVIWTMRKIAIYLGNAKLFVAFCIKRKEFNKWLKENDKKMHDATLTDKTN